jgi:hypothetical protein
VACSDKHSSLLQDGINLIYKSQCVFVCARVCISGIEIQTTGPISMKFGMGIHLNEGKVHTWDLTPYPPPLNRFRHASVASTVQFGENFIKQKFVGHPHFRWGRITFLDPSSRSGRTWDICISGAVVNQFHSCLITLI